MTIADKLTRLATAHDAIISAINAKGGSATGDGFEDFATDIAAIPTGSQVVGTDSKIVTASGNPTNLSFSDLKGEPLMFVLRLNGSVSSSGSTTYYYVVDIASYGADTIYANVFRIGNTRQVTSVTSGYSWTYSNGTLTVNAGQRTAAIGGFYNGSYELMYVYAT